MISSSLDVQWEEIGFDSSILGKGQKVSDIVNDAERSLLSETSAGTSHDVRNERRVNKLRTGEKVGQSEGWLSASVIDGLDVSSQERMTESEGSSRELIVQGRVDAVVISSIFVDVSD